MEKPKQLEAAINLLEHLRQDYEYFPDKVHAISKKHSQLFEIVKENNAFFENLELVSEQDDIQRLGKLLQEIVASYHEVVEKRDSFYSEVFRQTAKMFRFNSHYDDSQISYYLIEFSHFFKEKSDKLYMLRDLQYPNTIGYRDVIYFGASLTLHQKIKRMRYALEDLDVLCEDIKKNVELILTQSRHIYQIYFQDQDMYSYFYQEKIQEGYMLETEGIKIALSSIYDKLVAFSYNFFNDKEVITRMMSQFRSFHTDKLVITSDTQLDKSFHCIIGEGPFRGLIPIFETSEKYQRY
jgi:hypothetical protein